MSNPGTPSLDQLQVLLTVVETGSFAAAGRRLNRATSAISYTIANLEQLIGVALFDRERTRKPVLTKAGAAILSDARMVIRSVEGLRAKVKGLMEGLEPELSVALDTMLPTVHLLEVLRAFDREFPTVALRLHMEALGAVTELVLSGVASIGVSGPEHTATPGLTHRRIGDVELVAVAAPSHALAMFETIPPGEARNHAQLVLSDRSSLTEGRDFGVVGQRSWRLTDLGAKRDLLLAGLGWGTMPKPMILEDLEAGRLKTLIVPELRSGSYSMFAAYRSESPPGPAGAWLIERFEKQMTARGCKLATGQPQPSKP